MTTDDISNSNVLYAETPYGEYVGQFFTDSSLSTVYKPASANFEYINFRLDRSNTPNIETLAWSNLSANAAYLSFAAGFSNTDGKIIINPDQTIRGVNASCTASILTGGNPVNYAGTSRIKTTN